MRGFEVNERIELMVGDHTAEHDRKRRPARTAMPQRTSDLFCGVVGAVG